MPFILLLSTASPVQLFSRLRVPRPLVTLLSVDGTHSGILTYKLVFFIQAGQSTLVPSDSEAFRWIVIWPPY